MAVLVWDEEGTRQYEKGLDRGVLYLSDGRAVPWNGLTSVTEKFDVDVSPVYYDGMKVYDLVTMGDFSATMKAITYPDEFLEVEGYGLLRQGLLLGDQSLKTFSLSYRTRIGNDLEESAGYKIHIIYNLTAIPSDNEHLTISADSSVMEFQWDITATPEEIPGFRSTAHIIINSIDLDPELLTYIEEKLYGTEVVSASLISISDLISYMYSWARMDIINNGDGTWTAVCFFDSDLSIDETEQLFTLINADVNYIDSDTYEISTVLGTSDIP